MDGDFIIREHTSLLLRTIAEINTFDGFLARMDSMPFIDHPAGYRVQPVIRLDYVAHDSKREFLVSGQSKPPWIEEGQPFVRVSTSEPVVQAMLDSMNYWERSTGSCPKVTWIAKSPPSDDVWQTLGWKSQTEGVLTGQNVVTAITFCLEQLSRLKSMASGGQVESWIRWRLQTSLGADRPIWMADEFD